MAGKAKKNLNEKQKKFVREYAKDCNATQAAIRAGYSKKSAYSQGQRLLKHAEVGAALRKKIEKLEEQADVSATWVVKKLRTVAERCMQEVPVLDSEGKETGEFRFEHSGANKSLELIGKHLGMFKDLVEVDIPSLDKVLARLEATVSTDE